MSELQENQLPVREIRAVLGRFCWLTKKQNYRDEKYQRTSVCMRASTFPLFLSVIIYHMTVEGVASYALYKVNKCATMYIIICIYIFVENSH